MSDAYVMYDPTIGKRYAVCGSAKVEIDPLVFDAMIGAFDGDLNRMRENRLDEIRKLRANYRKQVLHLKDENRRLQEVVADGEMHAREILTENRKLRELAERAWKTSERLCQAFDGPCCSDGVTIAKPCPMGERDEECVYGQIQRELRELRIEVDG